MFPLFTSPVFRSPLYKTLIHIKEHFKTTSNLILKKSSNVNLSSEQCLGHAHIRLRVEVRPVPNEVGRLVDEHLDKVVVVLHRGGSLHHFLGDRDLEQLAVFTSWWYQDPKDKNQIIQSRLLYIQTMDSDDRRNLNNIRIKWYETIYAIVL